MLENKKPSKHTWGAWDSYRDYIVDPEGFSIALVMGNKVSKTGSDGDRDESEVQANLQLLKSAPKLLDALKTIYNEIDNLYDVDEGIPNIDGGLVDMIYQVKSVIDEAEGKKK